MSAPTIPSVVPSWTQGLSTQITQPPMAQSDSGWTPGELPPPDYMNWLFWILCLWVNYLQYYSPAVNPSNVTVYPTTGPNNVTSPTRNVVGNTTSAGFTETFPTASGNPGYKVSFANIGTANNMTIAVQTGDKLQGTLNGTYAVGPGEQITFISDGSAGYWQI